jgi:hypothetical protein
MGSILTRLTVTNPGDPSKRLRCEALGDTGSAMPVRYMDLKEMH